MKQLHADDLSIQKYAFDRTECEPSLVRHINICEACLAKVKSYASLAARVKAQPEPILTYNLSSLLLSQIQQKTEKSSKGSYLYALVISVAVCFFAVAIYLFTNTASYLLDGTPTHQVYFTISGVVFTFSILVFDQIRTFDRKLKTLTS